MVDVQAPENSTGAATGSPISSGEPLSLPFGAKARLAAEIVVAYAVAKRELGRQDLQQAVTAIRSPRRTRRASVLPDAAQQGRRLGEAVVRTLEAMPVDSRCLMRSLVLLRVLARRGVNGSLVIAVRPDELLKLAAHAWVEVDGRPLLAPAGPDHGRLVTL